VLRATLWSLVVVTQAPRDACRSRVRQERRRGCGRPPTCSGRVGPGLTCGVRWCTCGGKTLRPAWRLTNRSVSTRPA